MWRATATSLSYVPNPAMSSGFISSIPAGADATGGGGQNIEHDVICKVHITAGKEGLIRHLDFNGPHNACDPVAKRLAAWADSGSWSVHGHRALAPTCARRDTSGRRQRLHL